MKREELEAKFNSFYDETYEKAMSFCMAKTGDFINSEDLLADAYYSIYKRFSSRKEEELRDPKKYLFTVLKNQIAKYWVKHKKEQQCTVSADDETAFEALLETEFDLTEKTAIDRMLIEDILEFVSVQPGPQRRAFTMHFYLGKTIEETAAELELPVSTVRNYLYRLLKKIKDNFLQEYE